MASQADRRQALDAGFNEHLTKPVDLELLLLVLKQLLQMAQSSQGLGELETRSTVL
ncbi:hypothetical protein H6F86_00550 [Phormidium sp. FACHB-592]|uniref:Response regulatory domain-containing protein n=1 Tax=Stenomitos frigidus AS-A4 TaxID=2933935 RepID=A0ABV0KTJ4_9CYAN|nr:hypothetical protein [Phormidium sp. FACHB-592]MBD2072424.1 hypothetical protein [Phormidium sp. FACHB-592]